MIGPIQQQRLQNDFDTATVRILWIASRYLVHKDLQIPKKIAQNEK